MGVKTRRRLSEIIPGVDDEKAEGRMLSEEAWVAERVSKTLRCAVTTQSWGAEAGGCIAYYCDDNCWDDGLSFEDKVEVTQLVRSRLLLVVMADDEAFL